jgi:hypothetical protein
VVDLETLKKSMSTYSTGQSIMASFFVGLWLHKNRFEFDIFEAAGSLDQKSMKFIINWMARPFWP